MKNRIINVNGSVFLETDILICAFRSGNNTDNR